MPCYHCITGLRSWHSVMLLLDVFATENTDAVVEDGTTVQNTVGEETWENVLGINE